MTEKKLINQLHRSLSEASKAIAEAELNFGFDEYRRMDKALDEARTYLVKRPIEGEKSE